MEITDIGIEIASRAFWWTDGTKRGEIVVRLGKPQRFEDGLGMYCPIEMTGNGTKIRYAAGFDGIQAIALAFKMVKVNLEVLEEELKCELKWAGGGVADF